MKSSTWSCIICLLGIGLLFCALVITTFRVIPIELTKVGQNLCANNGGLKMVERHLFHNQHTFYCKDGMQSGKIRVDFTRETQTIPE
jgi:hypothetical protein